MKNYTQEFQKYGFGLNDKQIESFTLYLRELINSKINLTGFTLEEDIVEKNFLDSLSCFKSGFDFEGKKLIDIGTGGGFPGIPMKIILNKIELHLLEATGKKVEFLKGLTEKIGLKGILIHQGRAEDYARKPEFRGKFDFATARGLAPLPVSLECVLPFLKINGIFIAQKGEKYREEVHLSSKALKILGGDIIDIIHIDMPEVGDNKRLIIIKKISSTPQDYPRRAGIPAKKPL